MSKKYSRCLAKLPPKKVQQVGGSRLVSGMQMFGQHFCVSKLPSFLWQHTRKNIIVGRVFACKRLPNILFSDVVLSIQFKPTLIPLKFSLGCRGFGRHFDPDGSSVFLSSSVRTGARSRPRKWKRCVFQGHVPRACHKKEPRTGGGRPTKLTCKPFHGCVTEGNERNVIRTPRPPPKARFL